MSDNINIHQPRINKFTYNLSYEYYLNAWGGRQETFTKTAVSTNRDVPGNRDFLKVVKGRTQSLLRSCYHTFSKSLLGSVKGVRLEPILH